MFVYRTQRTKSIHRVSAVVRFARVIRAVLAVRAARLAVTVLVPALLAGCTARQEISLQADGSGEAAITIAVSAPLAAYFRDLNAGITGGDAESIFDLRAIEATIAADENLTLRRLYLTDPRTLFLSVRFSRLDALLASRSQVLSDAFRFEPAQNARRVSARVNRDVVERALEVMSIDSGVAEILLPPEGRMSATAYRDYLTWALEEYETDEPLALLIDRSVVETVVTYNGRTMAVTGGSTLPATAGRQPRVRFVTSVTEALTTAQALEYAVVFQP